MRWGLIGASRIASSYMIDAIRASLSASIDGVLSANEGRGQEFASRHNIQASFTDLSQMLNSVGIDAVYISTTNEKHKDQALAAIEAGKHVLCEKPLAMTVTDAVEMVQAAQNKGVVFATNHHLRNAGSHIAIRELIQSGKIGKVLSARVFHAVNLPEQLRGWRINDAAAGGGVIPDITVHDADTIRFHLGEDPICVVAKAGTSGLGEGVEDSVMSVWTMPSGTMVQTHESFTHAYAGTGIEFHGTGGSIIARNVMTQEPIGDIRLEGPEGSHSISFSTHNLYEYALNLFNEAVEGRGRPSADGVDGIKSLAVAMAVREAAANGTEVQVNYEGY